MTNKSYIFVYCATHERCHRFIRKKFNEMYACAIPATIRFAHNELVVHYEDYDMVYACFTKVDHRIKGMVFESAIFEDDLCETLKCLVMDRVWKYKNASRT